MLISALLHTCAVYLKESKESSHLCLSILISISVYIHIDLYKVLYTHMQIYNLYLYLCMCAKSL